MGTGALNGVSQMIEKIYYMLVAHELPVAVFGVRVIKPPRNLIEP